MSIEILTGVPGAGKTYYAVHKIRKSLQDHDKKFLILHNIEGLKAEDHRCISIPWEVGFFHAEAMAARLRGLREEYQLASEDVIHVYVDEAQRFFPPELKDTNVLYFFDYHRHFGVNVTLITQHEKKLTYKITTLAEIEIRAVNNRVNPLGSSFVYKLSSGGEQFGTERLSKDRAVFELYTSFQAGTGKSKKSSLRYIVLFVVVLAVVVWFLFFKVFARSFGLTGKEPTGHALAAPPPVESSKVPLSEARKKPDPAPAPPPAPKAIENKPSPDPEYLGPQIEEYSSTRDAVLVQVNDAGLKAWKPVREYVQDFPPMTYGYGYFHVPGRRFVVFSASNQETIFPVKNSVFVRTFIKSEPDSVAVSSADVEKPEEVFPLEFEDLPSGLQDRHGYTRADYEMIYARQHGFKSQPKPKMEPLTNSTAVSPTSPGESMQPGAQAGAAPADTPKSNRG